jgi:hypothetical protein
MASRVLVRRLNKVDLPTLGRPTRAITGTMRLSTALFQKIQKPLQGSGWCSGQHPKVSHALPKQGRLGVTPSIVLT